MNRHHEAWTYKKKKRKIMKKTQKTSQRKKVSIDISHLNHRLKESLL